MLVFCEFSAMHLLDECIEYLIIIGFVNIHCAPGFFIFLNHWAELQRIWIDHFKFCHRIFDGLKTRELEFEICIVILKFDRFINDFLITASVMHKVTLALCRYKPAFISIFCIYKPEAFGLLDLRE